MSEEKNGTRVHNVVAMCKQVKNPGEQQDPAQVDEELEDEICKFAEIFSQSHTLVEYITCPKKDYDKQMLYRANYGKMLSISKLEGEDEKLFLVWYDGDQVPTFPDYDSQLVAETENVDESGVCVLHPGLELPIDVAADCVASRVQYLSFMCMFDYIERQCEKLGAAQAENPDKKTE